MTEDADIWIGAGGQAPGVWYGTSSGVEQVIKLPAGQSVYALSLPLSGRRLFVGARNRAHRDRFGRLYLYDIEQEDKPKLVQSWWQETSVTTAALVTDTIGITGGTDGRLWFWEQGAESAITSIQAHEGAVLCIEVINNKAAASIGADGVLRLWNLDSLQEVASKPGPSNEQTNSSLLDVAIATDVGMFFSLHPDGQVLRHRIEQTAEGTDLATDRLDLPCSGVQSICTCGRFLVCSSLHEAKLYVLGLEDGEIISAVGCAHPAFRVASYSNEAVVTVHPHSDRVDFFRIGPEPGSISHCDVPDVRSVATPRRQLLVDQAVQQSMRQRRERLREVNEILNQPDFANVQRRAKEFISKGQDAEALTLLASWAAQHNRPDIELEARVQLASILPEESWCAPHYYALADLLAAWNEPAKALKVFEQVARCDTDYRDTASRAAALEDASILQTDEPRIRDDILVRGNKLAERGSDKAKKDVALQELRKHTILKKLWMDYLIPWKENEQWEVATPSDLLKPLNERISDKLLGDRWEKQSLTIIGPETSREATVFILRFAGRPEGLCYAFEVRDLDGQLILVHRLFYRLPNAVPTEATYERVAYAYEVAAEDRRIDASELQVWFSQTKQHAADVAKHVLGKILGQSQRRF